MRGLVRGAEEHFLSAVAITKERQGTHLLEICPDFQTFWDVSDMDRSKHP